MADVNFICLAVNRVEVDRFTYHYGPLNAPDHAERCMINAQIKGRVLDAAKYMKVCEILEAERDEAIYARN